MKASFVFHLIPIEDFLINPYFCSDFLPNSDYAESLSKIYSLQNISILMKNSSSEEKIVNRPKSSTLNSPIKSNSQNSIPNKFSNNSPINQKKKLYQKPSINCPIPNFLTPTRTSPSPDSHSPKRSFEGYDANLKDKDKEESPKSPFTFLGELPSYEEMNGNILNIAKSQNGSR